MKHAKYNVPFENFLNLSQLFNTNQSICIVCHEQRNVQHAVIHTKIAHGETNSQLRLLRVSLCVFFQTAAFASDIFYKAILSTVSFMIAFVLAP